MAPSIVLALSLLSAGPELIAHRGESADAPENTMAAFRLAWERKVPAIELDVHLTKDGRLAVCHDFDTKRCAGVACKIRESLWDELKDLDVGRKFAAKYTGEKLPLLDDALATVPDGARCFIEIKCGPEAIPALTKVVADCGKRPEQLAVISFNADAVAEAKRQLPQLKAYYLSSFKNSGTRWTPTAEQLIKQAKEINADGLDLAYRGPLDEAFVRRVRDAKLELYVWTVNDPDVARDLVKLGVDGITTDKAAWLREELAKPEEE
jgi:glycerophosphoryl diester phosphodiesterase